MDQEQTIYVSIPEAARKTGISRDYLYALVKSREIPFLKIGKKFMLNFAELLQYLQRRTEESRKGNGT